MDVILRDSHLDTRIKICILLNVIVPKLECGVVWEENKKLADNLETMQMSAAREDTRMFENNEQYSIKSRVGNVCSQNKQRHGKTEIVM